MKNQEIIAKAAVQIGLLTAAEAEKRLMNGEDIPLHTLQGWRLRGNYKVKDDAEPIEVKLWKRQEDGQFYLAKAYLYSEEQVQRNVFHVPLDIRPHRRCWWASGNT